jgi:DNA-binding Lrp family transcriptional regulator
MHDLKILDKKVELPELDDSVSGNLRVEVVLNKQYQYIMDEIPTISAHYTKSGDFVALLEVRNVEWFEEFLHENAAMIEVLRVLDRDEVRLSEIVQRVRSRCTK